MVIRITGDTMTLEINNRVVATARFSKYAAADVNSAWIVSTCTARLFDRRQAITVQAVAELLEPGSVTLSVVTGLST